MNLLSKRLICCFCVKSVSKLREEFSYKICYKPKYRFLNLKHTPTLALTNRLMRRGNFLKTYKLLKYYYHRYFLFTKFKDIPVSSNFLFFYLRYFSFRDSDRVFFWKYRQLDCMFTNKVKKLKKKKQQLTKLLFVTEQKRVPLCINFLKYTILLHSQRKKKNMKPTFFNPLTDFIVQNTVSMVTKVKFKLYKQKLMQLQS